MGYNSEYISPLAIGSRIARRHKSKKLDDNDIIEWCMEVECDILGDVGRMYKYLGFPLAVNNFRAKIPCNLWKVRDIYLIEDDPSSRINFTRMDGYFGFNPTMAADTVYIDYDGIPIDLETGIPMVAAGHEIACEAYCILSLYTDDIMNKRLDINEGMRLEQKAQAELLACFGSWDYQHKTRDDMNREHSIHYNLVPKPAALKLLSGQYK